MVADRHLSTTIARDQLIDIENHAAALLARLARIQTSVEAIQRLADDSLVAGLATNALAELQELRDDITEPAEDGRNAVCS